MKPVIIAVAGGSASGKTTVVNEILGKLDLKSVAIIKHPDGTTYMVALMSNVRKKNSANDHMALAAAIDKKVRGL